MDELLLAKLAKPVDARLDNLGSQGEPHEAESVITEQGRPFTTQRKEVGEQFACNAGIVPSL